MQRGAGENTKLPDEKQERKDGDDNRKRIRDCIRDDIIFLVPADDMLGRWYRFYGQVHGRFRLALDSSFNSKLRHKADINVEISASLVSCLTHPHEFHACQSVRGNKQPRRNFPRNWEPKTSLDEKVASNIQLQRLQVGVVVG